MYRISLFSSCFLERFCFSQDAPVQRKVFPLMNNSFEMRHLELVIQR